MDFLISVAVACLKGSQRLDNEPWAISRQDALSSVHIERNPKEMFLASNFKSFPKDLIERETRQYNRMLQILEEGPGFNPDPRKDYVRVVAWLCKSFHGFMCHVGAVSPEVQAHIEPLVHTPDVFLMTPSSEQRARAFHRLKGSKHPTRFAFYGAPLEFWHSLLRNEISVESSMEMLTHQKRGTSEASHGSGVYLAERLQHAVRYCSYDPTRQAPSLELVDGWFHSRYGRMFCVAVVEYVDRPDTATHYKDILAGRDDEVVVQDQNAVLVRAALIYRAAQFGELLGDQQAVSASEFVDALRSAAQQYLPELHECFRWLR